MHSSLIFAIGSIVALGVGYAGALFITNHKKPPAYTAKYINKLINGHFDNILFYNGRLYNCVKTASEQACPIHNVKHYTFYNDEKFFTCTSMIPFD